MTEEFLKKLNLYEKDLIQRTEYIKYGIDQGEFDIKKISPISNPHSIPVKPTGGLWASDIRADFGWKEWCIGEDFHLDALKTHTVFHLKENARILEIKTGKEVRDIFDKYRADRGIDFVKLSCIYDAVSCPEITSDIYYALYGWDCSSIVILNPEIIEVDERDKDINRMVYEEER